MRLEGQVAIITGVSHTGQVGYELASAFAREGAILAISSRRAERTNARARELRAEGAKVVAIPADLTTEQGASALVQKTLDEYGRINILVNLAGGLTKYGPSDELTLADWDFELNNNLRTAFLCTRAVWPIMKKQGGGKILNFSRAGGVQSAGPMMLAYNCAKAGIDALTRTFAKEGRNAGIYVYAIADNCTHIGGPLNEGELDGEVLTCPWHGAQFNICTGKVLRGPARQDIQTYAVRVDDRSIMVSLPEE